MKRIENNKVIVDNFEEVSKLIRFDKTDKLFCFLQIVARQKDHQEKISESTIQEYYIRSAEELMSRRQEIINLCQIYGARAYINVTPKSFKALQDEMLRALMERTISASNHSGLLPVSPRHLLKSIAGKLQGSRKETIWMIDVDSDEDSLAVAPWLNERGVIWDFIPTMSLGHYLTKAVFDTKEFEETFPNIHLHKNSMGTMLYFEKNI